MLMNMIRFLKSSLFRGAKSEKTDSSPFQSAFLSTFVPETVEIVSKSGETPERPSLLVRWVIYGLLLKAICNTGVDFVEIFHESLIQKGSSFA